MKSDELDNRPLSKRLYVVSDRNGDFVADVWPTAWQTINLHVEWTNDVNLAKCYTLEELRSVFIVFVCGYSAGLRRVL
jgi:hypothetical protein